MVTVKIALSGQIYNTSGVQFTFPESLQQHPEQPWLTSLDCDFRQEVRSVMRPGTSDKCFCVWSDKNGYFYSYLFPNEDSYAVVTANTGDKVPNDGGFLMDILEQLGEYFQKLPSAEAIDPTYVAGAANALRDCLTEAPKPIENGAVDIAYRTYSDSDELSDILQYA